LNLILLKGRKTFLHMKAKGIPTPQQTEAELTERIEASKVERKDFNKKIDVTIKESKKEYSDDRKG